MASKFQSRLVGTIVLMAVGVIVLPDVLDGKKSHYREDMIKMPISPKVDAEMDSAVREPIQDIVKLPDAPVEVIAGSEVENKNGVANTIATTAFPPKDEMKKFDDTAWIIQLMALKNKENASILIDDLKSRGYQAHIREEGVYSRIFVGPDILKSKLEQQLDDLEKITGSRGSLLKFQPLNP